MGESYSVEAILTAVDRSFSTTIKNAGDAAKSFSEKTVGMSSKLGKTMAIAGAAITAFGAQSLSSYGNFEASINKAAVIAGSSTKTISKDMSDLSIVANKMGKDLPLSAQDSADAMIAMAQNGASLESIKKTFPAIAMAATASGADLQTTAGVVQQAMNVWGDSLKSPEQAAAILTKSANLSNASIESMQQALSTIGPTATMAGMDLSTTSTAIGLLTNTGMSSAQAAQNLQHALLQMAAPSDKAKKLMNQLGLSYVDANGKIKPFKQILGEVKGALEGMSEAEKTAALKTLFHTSGLQAIAPLLKTVGKGGKDTATSWEAYSAAMDKSAGSTKKATNYLNDSAIAMQQNVGSKLEQVGGSWEALRNTAMSSTSGITTGLLETQSKMLEWATTSDSGLAKVTRGFIGLSPVIGPSVTAIGGFLANAGRIGSTLGSAMTAIGNFGRTAYVLIQVARGAEAGRAALAALANSSKIAAAAQWALNSSLLANPVTWVVAGIVALVAILAVFFTKTKMGQQLWANFIAWLKNAWDSLVQKATPVWQMIVDVIQMAAEWAKAAWADITEFFSNLWNSIVQVATDIWNVFIVGIMPIVEAFKNLWSVLSEFFSVLWNSIVTGSLSIWNSLVAIITPVIEAFKAVWETLKPYFQLLWNFIKGIIQAELAVIQSTVTTIMNVIKSIWQAAWDIILAVITYIWNMISTVVSTVINVIAGIIRAVTAAIKGDWQGVWNAIKGIAETIWNGIKSVITTLLNTIKSVISSIMTAIKGVMSSIWNGIKSSVTGIVRGMSSAVISVFNSMKSRISGVINGVKRILNGLRNVDLSSAGRAIINGFLNGLKAGFEAVKGFVSGIAGWIRAHKGPISYDKKLLIPAGDAIMSGFDKSLRTNFQTVQKRVSGMASALQTKFHAGINNKQSYTSEVINSPQPANILLRLGSSDYRAFVSDITNAQDAESRLTSAY